MRYEDMKMGELRELFPNIKATSKKGFIEQINNQEVTDINTINKVSNIIPSDLLQALKDEIGCDCNDEAYIFFMDVMHKINRRLQVGINKAYTEIFKKKANYTRCGSCMKGRVEKLRLYFKDKIG